GDDRREGALVRQRREPDDRPAVRAHLGRPWYRLRHRGARDGRSREPGGGDPAGGEAGGDPLSGPTQGRFSDSLRTRSMAGWTFRLAATMSPFFRKSSRPWKSLTAPPASRTRRLPAATSHGDSDISQKPS